MNICIDWGNTRVKFAFLDKENKVSKAKNVSADEALTAITSAIEREKPQGGVLCSVTSASKEVEALLKKSLTHFIVLNKSTHVQVANSYQTPETLGNDRIAMVVAANHLFPDKNNLVISVGTCITYNIVLKNKAFRGGAISPGLTMRMKSMHDYTNALPEVDLKGDLRLLGYDTATSMRSGVINGTIAEIEGMMKAFETEYGDFNAVLTGGDAPLIESKLKSKIFADPELTLKGLNQILKHNVPQLR